MEVVGGFTGRVLVGVTEADLPPMVGKAWGLNVSTQQLAIVENNLTVNFLQESFGRLLWCGSR